MLQWIASKYSLDAQLSPSCIAVAKLLLLLLLLLRLPHQTICLLRTEGRKWMQG